MSETKKIIRQSVANFGLLANRQIGVLESADVDLGFIAWGGKDAAGDVTVFLAKDKPGILSTLQITGIADGNVGVLKYDADGVVDGLADLSMLNDVDIESPANLDALLYNSTSEKWENTSIVTDGLNYKGTWNADTNSPELSDGGGGGEKGDFYIVAVAGTTLIDGWNDWEIHDWIVNDGTQWDKIDNTDALFTFDQIYHHESGEHVITMDDGDVVWYPTGAYNHVIQVNDATDGYGFIVRHYIPPNGSTTHLSLLEKTNQLELTSNLYAFNLHGINESTIYSEDVLHLGSEGAGDWHVIGADLTLYTTTSGDVILTAADAMLFTAGENFGFNNSLFATSELGCLAIHSGTLPTAAWPADVAHIGVADRGGVAGKAAVHLYCEDGTPHVFGDYVGIGTITPSYKLDVNGNINVAATYAYKYNGVNVIYAQTANNNWFLANSGNASVSGNNNVSVGSGALHALTSGTRSIAIGTNALYSVTSGDYNVAIGYEALYSITTGSDYNVAVGYSSLKSLGVSQDYNVAVGPYALEELITGSGNTAIGRAAGEKITGGSTNLTIASQCIYLGGLTKAYVDSVTNEIVIGYDATGIGSNSVILGNSSITKTQLQGSVGIGTSTPVTLLDQAKWSADAVGSYHSFTKSRNATPGSHTIVVDNDVIGGIDFRPSDGVDFGTVGARIHAEVDDAAPAASSIGVALVLSTAAGVGADDLTERIRISAAGILSGPYILKNTTIDIGYSKDGAVPPALEDVVTQTDGSVRARVFSHSATQDVVIPWRVPDNIVAGSGIKFKVHGIITSSTAPAAGEGVSFKLSGYSRGTGDSLDGTFGEEIEANITDLDAVGVNAQYDLFTTAYSGIVTITDLAAGELVMLHFERDQADADDDYAQDLGVIGITIQWTQQLPAS